MKTQELNYFKGCEVVQITEGKTAIPEPGVTSQATFAS